MCAWTPWVGVPRTTGLQHPHRASMVAQLSVRQTWGSGHACQVTSGKSLPSLGTSLPICGERHGQAQCILWSPRYCGATAGSGEGLWVHNPAFPGVALHAGLGYLEILIDLHFCVPYCHSAAGSCLVLDAQQPSGACPSVQWWEQRLRGRPVGGPSHQARELGFALLPEVATRGTIS